MESFKKKAQSSSKDKSQSIGDSPLINTINNTPSQATTTAPVQPQSVPVNKLKPSDERRKIVQAKLSVEDYAALMDIKIKRDQNIGDLLNEAVKYWLAHQ